MLLTTADTHSVNPVVYRRLPYRPQDFLPVAPVARLVFALAARRGLGVHDAGGFVHAARRAPVPLTFSSWGVASTSQVMMETFRAEQGLTCGTSRSRAPPRPSPRCWRTRWTA
jgi:tripartite-type tricarboxylate transporter receptor subunit TctC